MSNTKSTSSNEIVIDISKSVNPTFFENDGIIHQTDFKRVSSWIEERLDELKRVKGSEPEENQARYNDTISILGSRGSGKTSFLMSLIQKYEKSKELEVIEIIDPTLIEEKGHIFLTILSLIQEKVMDKLKDGCYELENINYRVREEWDSKLKKLSEGIPSIDGIGQDYQSADWMSAEHIMNKGLKSVMAAKKLESNFNKLVDCSLRILDKKAFLFIFDDIDIDFRKGWPVLETIRKYMTSARIITLLSGDLRLYSKAIRKQQWKNFGKALLINEAERLKRATDYDALVTEMEGQYLQKVIRPERRIYLETLQEKKDRYNQLDIKVKKNGKGEDSKLIIELYYEILKQHGISNKQEADPYQTFLLNLPLRSQIQLLAEFYTSKEDNSQLDIDLAKVFLSDIYNKGIDIELASSNHKMIISTILGLLIQEKKIADSYQLQPTTQDHSLNASFVALSFLLSNRIALYPELVFEYLIKIGYVRNLMDFFTYDSQTTKERISIDLLVNHAGLLQENVLKATVAKTASVLQSHDKGTRLYQGFIPLYGIKKGEIIETESEAKNILSMLPSTALNLSNQNNYYSSIYLILGALGDLIKYADNEEGFIAHFMELAQLKTYKVPYVSSQTSEGEIDEEEEEKKNQKSLDEQNKNFEDLILAIRTWAVDIKEMGLSPHFLGKVSTRLHSSLDNLVPYFKNSEVYLAEALELSIFSFFNAVLVEEVRENIKGGINLNLNSLATGDSVFVQNLNKVVELTREQLESLGLTIHVFRCPLFWLYLKPLEDNCDGRESIMKFFINLYGKLLDQRDKVFEYINKYNIYKELNKVRIYKKEKPKKNREHFGSSAEKFERNIKTLKDAGLWNEVDKHIREYFESTKDRRAEILNDILKRIKKDLFTGVAEGTLKKFFEYVHKNQYRKQLI